MSQMAMLYKYEFRKIAKRKIIWISLLISVIIILPTIGGPVLDFLYESSGTETAYQAFLKDREYEKKLEGRLIDQSLLEETMEAYGKIPQTEGPYSATEEYRTYARPYSAIFRFVRVMTDMTVNESLNWEADEQELYAGNRVLLMRTADRYRLTPEETEFWLRQEEQKPWPVEYRYKEGWWRLLDCVYTIGLLAIMVTAICLSGPFVEEHTRKTDQLILSSRYGRQPCFWAKFLAGLTFALALSLFFTAVSVLTAFAVYGAEGFTADFRLTGGYFPSVTLGEAVLISYGCMTAAVLVAGAFVMVLSELLKSSIGALSLVTGMVLLSMWVDIPEHLRVLSQIWSYMPSEFIAQWNLFNPRTVPLFGAFFLSWQVVPVLYLLLGLLFALTGRALFVRYQVRGR